MSEEIINPFKQKKVDWAQKSRDRLVSKNIKENTELKQESIEITSKPSKLKTNKPSKTEIRVAKSFKIFKGQLARDFDKRVNKLQVHFDDLNFDKNYVDSGKYIMFLMAFSEKYGLYELYKEISGNGEIEVSKQEMLNHFGKILQ